MYCGFLLSPFSEFQPFSHSEGNREGSLWQGENVAKNETLGIAYRNRMWQ